ncbi:MAG: DEDD exonuclease domain-containing protein [Acidimicrobiales bacterium]
MLNQTLQGTLDDLGTPLHDVTFVVFDVETTGEPVNIGAITEIGAVKLKGGECLGTFQTLIDPVRAIPPHISVLTGITEAMITRAPRIEQILPSFLEFVGEAVVVGHNVRYDLSFVGAALERNGYPRLTNRSVDTLPLARRLLAEEVPNCKLGTLARALRLPHQPEHRALHDALATGDLLHYLLERASSLGVLGLDDLITLPKLARHPQAQKLSLTEHLPRSPGVYAFFDRDERLLYVGKATDLRRRVRSYFSGEQRRKVGSLLRETAHIRHQVCSGLQEAEITELRLIRAHLPRFNRQGTRWKSYRYLKITLGETFPRLVAARTIQDDGGLYLGPFASQRIVTQLIEALHTATRIRRCRNRPSRRKPGSCAAAQIGVSTCPCSGDISEEKYPEVVEQLVRGLMTHPDILFDPLTHQMHRLAAEQRFEEAAECRERIQVLSEALRRQRQLTMMRSAGALCLTVPGRGGMDILDGQLIDSWADGPRQLQLAKPTCMGLELPGHQSLDVGKPLPAEVTDEVLHIARWIERNAQTINLSSCELGLHLPTSQLPRIKLKQEVSPVRRRGR